MSKGPDKTLEREEAFLSRWSRLKGEEREFPAPLPAGEPGEGESTATEPERSEEEIVASLPDIETLEEASDFTPFLREGVPELLKRKALRRLWRLNPVFAEIDGLAEYAEDYSDAATVAANANSAYQVGRGYLIPESEDGDVDRGDEPGERGGGETETAVSDVDEDQVDAPQPEVESQSVPSLEQAVSEPSTALAASTPPPEPAPLRRKGRASERRWGPQES